MKANDRREVLIVFDRAYGAAQSALARAFNEAKDGLRALAEQKKPAAPRWPHACDQCVYLGRAEDAKVGEVDLWACPRPRGLVHLAVRYGPGSEYSSGASLDGEPPTGEDSVIMEAYRRAVARGIITQPNLAEPEKPVLGSHILASPDERFRMRVWVKPKRLEAVIDAQPEEWRRTGADSEGYPGKWLDCGRDREVCSYNLPGFSYATITLFLRGIDKAMDSQIFARDFVSDSDRDEYLAKLEATVAAMPKVEKKPEPKFEVGQWAETPSGHKARIQFSSLGVSGWEYRFSEPGHWFMQCELKPCSPVCTAEQMSILPGDEVQMDEVPVGEDGKPLRADGLECAHAGRQGTILEQHWADGRFLVYLRCEGRRFHTYRWNLDLIKRGPAGPGGQPCK